MRSIQLMIYIIITLHLILAVTLLHYQAKNSPLRRIFNKTTTSVYFFPNLNTSFSLTISRRKREDDEIDDLLTRHSKNHKRHCKNNSTCSHIETPEQIFQQDNDYESEESRLMTKTRASNEKDENINTQLEDIDIYNNGSSIIDGYVEDKDKDTIGDYDDNRDFSSIYKTSDDFSGMLTNLFQALLNTSLETDHNNFKELHFVREKFDTDPCQKWLNNEDKLEAAFLGHLVVLPACPCKYPNIIFYDNNLWDEKQKKHYRWRDVSSASYRLDVYKPGAAYCVRTLLATGSGSAQHCCYDSDRNLITRGSGAGTPYFVSPDISLILHEKIDILPWRLCKGDFSRFNKVRPPNNDNGCNENPDNEEYQRQINSTKYY
ncbi:isthmin-1-like isoform X1 [Vespa mandarinia]|uniref:isthmin-1-like isoform X1 n=1 Tax=Vespa mandarinia TaxID=7446 RepID=UPI0016074F20|nr:isthmin-1-like isoform X1 [Vespa mandarinia]